MENRLFPFDPVESGILQGTILGPLFVVMYIYDICCSVEDNKTILFAATRNLYGRANNVNACISLENYLVRMRMFLDGSVAIECEHLKM